MEVIIYICEPGLYIHFCFWCRVSEIGHVLTKRSCRLCSFFVGTAPTCHTETGRVQITEGDGRAIWWSCKTGLFTRLLQVKHIQVHQTYANIGYSIRYWRFVAAGLGKVSLFRFTSSPGFSTVLMNVLSWGFRTVKDFFSDIDLTKVFKDFNRYFAMSML